MKYLITGLGNIGSEYWGTRHNIGFRVVNHLVESVGGNFTEERYGAIARIRVKNCDLIVLKPNTFMNLSGNAVRYWLQKENITAAWVPGAFEIPITAQKMAQSGKYDAIICVGAVIRGDTSHYDLVCNESAKGIAQVELATGIPVLFGVITTENIEQAIARAGSKAGNKGYDCALSAIEMVNLMKQL